MVSYYNDSNVTRILYKQAAMKIITFLFLALSVTPSNAFFGLFGDSSGSSTTKTNGNNEESSPLVPGEESIMSQKEHGTSHTPVQSNLRWGCDESTADRICNYNRHWAEQGGYWESTSFLTETAEAQASEQPVIFYDSNTGEKLYTAPLDRSWADFIAESKKHGWPSFRDNEVNWDVVRVLKNGETVSVDGTHLGHNLPDAKGNRYCINLVSIAGNVVTRKLRPYRSEADDEKADEDL